MVSVEGPEGKSPTPSPVLPKPCLTHSDSGKSSLLMTLLGFLSYSGNIKIDGLEISAVQRDELRGRITTISQEQLELAGSIRANLRPYDLDGKGTVYTSYLDSKSQSKDGDATPRNNDDELQALLERLCLWEAITATSGGLDGTLADASLSHGQMQLLCLARGILRRRTTGSRVVLVDEATSSVDPMTDAAARLVMADEFAGCTVLTVTHRPETLAAADVRVELAQGRICAVQETVAATREREERKKCGIEDAGRRREASMAAIAQMAKAVKR